MAANDGQRQCRMAVLGVWPWASFAQHYGKHDGLFDVIDGANLWVVPQVRETTPSCPAVGPTLLQLAFYSRILAGMHGPTRNFWANLTPFSLQTVAAAEQYTADVAALRALVPDDFGLIGGDYVLYDLPDWEDPRSYYSILNQSLALYDSGQIEGGRGWRSHAHTPPYILFVILHTKQTGDVQNLMACPPTANRIEGSWLFAGVRFTWPVKSFSCSPVYYFHQRFFIQSNQGGVEMTSPPAARSGSRPGASTRPSGTGWPSRGGWTSTTTRTSAQWRGPSPLRPAPLA
jgi:hypothetical protein